MIARKKIFLLIISLFIFFSYLDVFAATSIPDEVDTGVDNFTSNLITPNDDYSTIYKSIIFISAQETDSSLNDKDCAGFGTGDTLILNGDYNNVSNFVYSFIGNLKYYMKANHLYEFHWYFKVSKDMDVIDSFDKVSHDDISFVANVKNNNGDVIGCTELDVDNYGYYIVVHDSESGGYLYDLCIQFAPTEDIDFLTFTIGDNVDLDNINNYLLRGTKNPFEDKIIKYFNNITEKNLVISLTGGSAFEVEEFSNSSGNVHGGGGIDFDGNRTDDWLLHDELETCDTLDVVCHVRNLGTRFKQLLTRLANGIQAIVNAIKDIVISILDGILSILKSLFIPKDGFIENHFLALKQFFNEKLGILVYPIDLIFDVFDRFNNISSPTNAIIHIPNISLGPFGTIIKEKTFTLNEYWNTEPYSTLYNVYLSFVHCFIGFCLYKLALKKEEEIIGGGSN